VVCVGARPSRPYADTGSVAPGDRRSHLADATVDLSVVVVFQHAPRGRARSTAVALPGGVDDVTSDRRRERLDDQEVKHRSSRVRFRPCYLTRAARSRGARAERGDPQVLVYERRPDTIDAHVLTPGVLASASTVPTYARLSPATQQGVGPGNKVMPSTSAATPRTRIVSSTPSTGPTTGTAVDIGFIGDRPARRVRVVRMFTHRSLLDR
jgi:hypothetical protein